MFSTCCLLSAQPDLSHLFLAYFFRIIPSPATHSGQIRTFFRTAFSSFHSETKVFCQRLKPYRNHKSPYPPDSVITKILLRYPGQTLLYPLCPTSLYIKYFRESLCQPSSCIRCNCVINYNTTVDFVKGFSKEFHFSPVVIECTVFSFNCALHNNIRISVFSAFYTEKMLHCCYIAHSLYCFV